MSRVFNATTDHLDAAVYSIAMPFCMGLWLKQTAGGANNRCLVIGTTASATNRYDLSIGATGVGTATQNDGTNSAAGSGNFSDGAWHFLGGLFTNDSSRSAFFDGGSKVTNSTARTAITPDALRISCDLLTTQAFHGLAAHACIWGGALSDAEWLQLGTTPPLFVRTDLILDYWSLLDNPPTAEHSGGPRGTVLTVTGTTFSTDNPVFPQQALRPQCWT